MYEEQKFNFLCCGCRASIIPKGSQKRGAWELAVFLELLQSTKHLEDFNLIMGSFGQRHFQEPMRLFLAPTPLSDLS